MADNRGPELLIVNIVFFTVTAIIILLRCYTRALVAKAFGKDDWLMVIATIFYLAYIITSNIGIDYGTGRHKADLTTEDFQTAKMCWFLCYLFFGLSICAAKLSFGWLLLRIVIMPIHAVAVYATSGLVIICAIVYFFVTIFHCYPTKKYWNDSIPGTCIPEPIFVKLGYLYSAVSLLTDLVYAMLPAFIIWNIQLKTRIRLIIIMLMGMGLMASSAVIARIYYLQRFLDPDFLYATTDIAIWSTIEMGLAISAASVATLRPLARKLGWSVGFSSNGSGRTPSNDPKSGGSYNRRRPSSPFGLKTIGGSYMHDGTSAAEGSGKAATPRQQESQDQLDRHDEHVEHDDHEADWPLSDLPLPGPVYKTSSENQDGRPTAWSISTRESEAVRGVTPKDYVV